MDSSCVLPVSIRATLLLHAGLYDMMGNTWEWTSTPFSAAQPMFVLRGGSWIDTVDGSANHKARITTRWVIQKHDALHFQTLESHTAPAQKSWRMLWLCVLKDGQHSGLCLGQPGFQVCGRWWTQTREEESPSWTLAKHQEKDSNVLRSEIKTEKKESRAQVLMTNHGFECGTMMIKRE